jgi:hypothetical protein
MVEDMSPIEEGTVEDMSPIEEGTAGDMSPIEEGMEAMEVITQHIEGDAAMEVMQTTE